MSKGGVFLKIINSKTVVVYSSEELTNALEFDNGYEYIYLGSDITLENGILINDNKSKVIIDGTYLNVKYTLTGMNSVETTDTISANVNSTSIKVKNINIDYTNIYGVIYVPLDQEYSNILVVYENITFNGTELSFNPYGTTKIVDSIITIEETNGVKSEEVCESNYVIIGGNTTISSSSPDNSLFYFRNDTTNPSVMFLCKSNVKITSDTKDFMNGTTKLNFTILHDTEVNLVTGNGFAATTINGVNNVLIDERASLIFIENKHYRIPMWSIYGTFTMKEGSSLQVINSYDNTPTDNYNLHFKGTNSKLILENPKTLIFYTKNANVIYTNNDLEFKIKCKRINFWNDSTTLTSAGDINNLPDYSWYKDNALLEINGTLTSTDTTITEHNLTSEELTNLPDLTNFKFQSKKQLSIGEVPMNIHQINATKNTISGHTLSFADVLIKYDGNEEIVNADDDGFFEYNITTPITDGTELELTSNVASSFVYGTRKITTPHEGELSLLETDTTMVFQLTPISTNPLVLPRNKDLVIKVVDSRLNSTDWKLYAYIDSHLTSLRGFVLEDALIFKKLSNESIVLSDTPVVIFNKSDSQTSNELTVITWSKEKGPLLDLSNNSLEANEEYFANIYFVLED